MDIKPIFIALILVCQVQQVSAVQLQTMTSIQEAIKHYVASNISSVTDYKLSLNQFDNRLRLPRCVEPLDIFLRGHVIKSGRNALGVRCNSVKKWTIYVVANVSIYRNVISLSRSIRRGEILKKNMLQFEKRDIAHLRQGYFTDLNEVINKEAYRNLNLGMVINKTSITEPKLIKRREKVKIKARSANLEISSTGIALMDGVKGQTIKVKNLRSKQIIQAIVVKSGQVEVPF